MRLLTPAAFVVAGVLPAQGDHFTPSPNGFSGVEGNRSMNLIGAQPLLRFQQVDSTNLGGKSSRTRMAFRRDATTGTGNYPGRNVELEIAWGEGDIGTFDNDFDSNFISGTKTVVLQRTTVSLPDWSLQPSSTPQPGSDWWYVNFDNGVSYSYPPKATNGTDLLWEVRVFSISNPAGGFYTPGDAYPMDADDVTNVALQGMTSGFGSSCTVAGQTRSISSHTDAWTLPGGTMELRMDISRAPANQPWATLFGLTPATYTIPGLCSNFEVIPDIFVFINGITDANGSGSHTVPFANYRPSWAGFSVYGQQLVVNPGPEPQLAVGNARHTLLPPPPPAGAACKFCFAFDPNASTATSGVQDGGITMFSNHP